MDLPASLAAFGRCTVVKETGSTRVLRANDPRDGRPVALKVIAVSGDLPTMGSRIERFRRHTAALQGTKTGVIPEILQVGADDTHQVFLVTEWIEGELLTIPSALDLVQLVGELAAVLEALEQIAKFGEGHLNVRPDNLYWSEAGLHLLGLGTQHLLDGDLGPFVAPELPVVKAARGRLWRADVFSFARTACTVLGAEVEGSGTAAPFIQFPGPVREQLRGVEGLRLVLESGLHQQPARRPASFSVIHRALLNSIKPATGSYSFEDVKAVSQGDSEREGSASESKALVFRAEHQSEPVESETLGAARDAFESVAQQHSETDRQAQLVAEPGQTGLTAELDRALVGLEGELKQSESQRDESPGVAVIERTEPESLPQDGVRQRGPIIEPLVAPLLEIEQDRPQDSPVELPISEILATLDRHVLPPPPKIDGPIEQAEATELPQSQAPPSPQPVEEEPGPRAWSRHESQEPAPDASDASDEVESLGSVIEIKASRPSIPVEPGNQPKLRSPPEAPDLELEPSAHQAPNRRGSSRRRVLWLLLAAAILVWGTLLGAELFQNWLVQRVESGSSAEPGSPAVEEGQEALAARGLPAGATSRESAQERAELRARIEESEQDVRIRRVLETVESSKRARRPHRGLAALAGLAPELRDQLASEEDALQAELSRLDRGAPTLVISAASRQTQSGDGVVRLDATDDYQVDRLEVFAVLPNTSASERLKLRPLGGPRYEVVVPRRLRHGRSVLLWGRAWDRSGHQGLLGSEAGPVHFRLGS